jgi:hypothetical protein
MGTNLLDFGDPFVRELWATFLPSAFVILFCVTLIPVPGKIRSAWHRISRPLRNSLSLEQAEAYETAYQKAKRSPPDHSTPKSVTSIFRTTTLSGLALLQVLAWLGLGSYSFAVNAEAQNGFIPVVTALTWLYASLRPIMWPSPTVFYDLFALYLAHLVTGLITLGGLFFDHSVYQLPLPSRIALAARVINLSVVTISLIVVLNMPLAVPSATINEDDVGKSVSPEDYCSLWDWISFHWVVPLIRKGTYNTLNEDDVWKLSPTLCSRPLTSLYKDLGHASIVWKLWTANSSDMIWDFFLTLISVTLTYAGPFFLQRILSAIDKPTPDNHAKAYIYAFAAFLTTLLKVSHPNCTTRNFLLIILLQAQTDCLHLWFGRRAQVRIRTLLMASIYDKALKRKDFSGTVRKDSADAEKTNDPKSSADVGKVVNMMSGDANQIAFLVSGMYFLYGAPFEIALAGIYLYNLLGWSAFSGLVVLVVFWPLNQLVASSLWALHGLTPLQVFGPPFYINLEGPPSRSRQTYGSSERASWCHQIHQILRMGGPLDSANYGCQEERTLVDGQIPYQLSPFLCDLDFGTNFRFCRLLCVLHLGWKSTHGQRCVHRHIFVRDGPRPLERHPYMDRVYATDQGRIRSHSRVH